MEKKTMGARANVVLVGTLPKNTAVNMTNEDLLEYSPVIYTHWSGSEINNVVQEFIDKYITDISDTNIEPSMRREVERAFPIFTQILDGKGIKYSVFNFPRAVDFERKLPTANDMPMIADDYGTYIINVNTMSAHVSMFDWKRATEEQ
jgi:hypothetical protein